MILQSLEGLLVLTYLTKYNINTIYEFLNAHSTLEELVKNVSNSNRLKINNSDIKNAKISAKLALEKLKYFNIQTCTIFEEHYPQSLKNIKNSPPVLYTKGKFITNRKLAAVVGSRKISKQGEQKTRLITKEFVRLGYGIVSGLAHGVDGFAHHETIKNKGYTIAVLPNPLDSIYPKNHWRLANSILNSGGALISELPFLINRGKQSFIERNRIQAGLSKIITPAEMRVASGTMHTIKFAVSQKKWVCLPDFPDDYIEDNGIKYLAEKSKKDNNKSFFIVNSINDLEQKIIDLDNNNLSPNLFS